MPTSQTIDEMIPVIIPSLNEQQAIREAPVNEAVIVPSYGLPREAAPITSTHNIRLRMNPASKLNGVPGEKLNVS